MLKALVLVALVSGCTPRMHRAYRTTMQVVGAAAVLCDDGQTRHAMAMGYPESNPFLGDRPSGAVLTAATLVSLGFFYALGRLPERLPEYARDVVVTSAVAVQSFVVYANSQNIGMPLTQCGAP